MDESIRHNLQKINERIYRACERSRREPKDVRLLLATKTVPADRIKPALEAGHTLIGENKVQEIRDKYEALQSTPHETHFIGHLQTNKIKDILKHNVTCIQSIDRWDLAEKLHQRLALENKTMDILIQVNTSNEQSKFGIHPDHAVDLALQVAQLNTLRIKGLMTIGLFSSVAVDVRACFQKLNATRHRINDAGIPGVDMRELSMGMSGDLEIAIEEGATIVRVGTAIFGKRIYADSYYWPETTPLP